MKQRIISIYLLFISLLSIQGVAVSQPHFKTSYYKLMESGSIEGVNKLLDKFDQPSNTDEEAYKAGLLMKKAGMVSKPAEKLKLFRQGRNKLEDIISQYPENTEWRFIRLIIQEHAPRIVNYNDDKKGDGEFIQLSFKKLTPELQSAVLDYRKHSNTLQPLNF